MRRSMVASGLAIAVCGLVSMASAAERPVKVFVLAGQSNMQGHAHVRTFDSMAWNPTTAAILKEMRNADGSTKVLDQVWISSLGSDDAVRVGKLTAGFGPGGSKIGPEFTFGIYMFKHLGEPIVLIKTAWGGRSLHTDFRSPSAGPYAFSPEQLENFKKQNKNLEQVKADKDKLTGRNYREMIDHVKATLADLKKTYPDYDPKVGYELAGFVWFQGWNDMVDQGVYPNRDKPGGYDAYSVNLGHFIRDVRKDLKAPQLPFVIGVMGVGGPLESYGPKQAREKTIHGNFRAAMAAPAGLPEFKGNVVNVFTANYWDMEFVALQAKEAALKPKVDELNGGGAKGKKVGKAKNGDAKAAIDKLYAETFTKDELKVLKESVSNGGFHYLGSARIMAQIGKGFAEAMATLVGDKKQNTK